MISAPEATEPTTVTSPSGKMIDWPERTGLSSSSEAGVGFAGGPAGVAGGTDFLSLAGAGSSTSPALRPPTIGGGRPRPSSDGSAPSMPMMRMPRPCSWAMRWLSSPLSCGSADTSRTIARPAKKPGERAISASRSSSHSATGPSGASTSAMKERPLNRIERGLRAAFGTGRDDSWKTRFGAERG